MDDTVTFFYNIKTLKVSPISGLCFYSVAQSMPENGNYSFVLIIPEISSGCGRGTVVMVLRKSQSSGRSGGKGENILKLCENIVRC